MRDFIGQLVAGGFYTEPEIVQHAVDYLGDEQPEDVLHPHAVLMAAEAISQHLLDQKNWPARTDCDRLDDAFAELDESGIISRQNFRCCGNCGSYEIGDEMRQAMSDGRKVRGYTFYHMQDTDSAVEGGGVFLAYGSVDEPQKAHVNIGHEIVKVLKRHTLRPEWDGSLQKRIKVPLDWKRRRFTPIPPNLYKHWPKIVKLLREGELVYGDTTASRRRTSF